MNGRTDASRLLLTFLAAGITAGTAACAAPAGTPTAGAPPTVRLTAPSPAPTTTATATGIETTIAAPASPSTSPASSLTAEDPDATVEQLAVAWLVAYRTASFTGAADAWIDRTASYVTDQLAQQNLQLRRDGRGPGMAWQDFVDRRCTARVDDAAAVIPPEAPRTDTTVHVQAAGTLHTTCATGTDPADEALAVTLTAVRTDGGWRIASRDY
ncbi:hypothetical protein [Nakamurella endophytica]|uniref:Nuclear transport factor 2 family protein n=1 Tax=Nakamurella endophytica TaxID=1748367 RepID=A0A917WJ69_9ACTN|nr:hypothetical protein [Nakamurella endophytica]GGM09930.1 hypothetical protein GCM10011594_32280 [Nakamurella endophytica]